MFPVKACLVFQKKEEEEEKSRGMFGSLPDLAGAFLSNVWQSTKFFKHWLVSKLWLKKGKKKTSWPILVYFLPMFGRSLGGQKQ